MAAFRYFKRYCMTLLNSGFKQPSKLRPSNKGLKFIFYSAAGCGSILAVHAFISSKFQPVSLPIVYAAKDEEDDKGKSSHMNYREMRFRHFASVEFDGNLYMTPQDFLESLTEESPRARIGRTRLAQSDVDYMLRQTPSLSRGNDKLFRKLHDKGIISYTEYLFLLCVLTKPHSGFRIAFNMFDTDGNQIVDKREFLVLEKVFSNGSKSTSSGKDKDSGEKSDGKQVKRAQDLNQQIHDTTLLVHFFGKDGKSVLKYKDFHRFMENLQSEVIELEFLEFSKGLNTISEVEFAKILLRYTNLDRGDVEACLDRVRERMPSEKGITFAEFKKFCQFLNNLDDFAIAMKMYTYAQQPVSQEEFQRAVMVCTGYSLGSHIVNTLFNIFDTDGDGNLSHKEFISLMKDRLHRGARSHLMHSQNTWEAFKTCVKNEMRTF